MASPSELADGALDLSSATTPRDLDGELEELWRKSNLTAAQALVWLSQQRHPSLPIHQNAVLWIIPAEIERVRFEQAFQRVVDGCDTLRTVLEEQAGVPVQRVLPEVRDPLEFLDLASHSNPVEAARSWAKQRCQKLFDLGQPLFDSVLIRLGQGQFAWYLNQHRIIADGWSTLLIFRRTAEAYQASLHGTAEALPVAPLFADFVAAERPFAGTPKHQKAWQYWQQKFSRTPPRLSFAEAVPAVPGTERGRISRTIGPARTQRLREICTGPAFAGAFQNLSLFSVFTGLFLTCLFHRSGQQRFALGILASARTTRKLEETAGLCTHTVVEHFGVSGDETLIALSSIVRSEMVEVLRQQAYVVSTLPPRQLFDAAIILCQGKTGTFLGSSVHTEYVETGYQDDSQEKLALQVRDYDDAGQYTLDFDFRLDTFDEAERQKLVRHFFGVLDAFLADNERLVRDLCPIAPDEIIDPQDGAFPLVSSTPAPGDEEPTPIAPAGTTGDAAPARPEDVRPAARSEVAPRSPTEETLARIWRELLELKTVGIHDNFFDLGGRSVMAVQLFAMVDEELGVDLPISALFEAPTIAQLAGIIEREDPAGRQWPSLVPIRAGTGPAIFCLPGVRGDILRFRDLTKRLDLTRPMYSLRARGLDGMQAPHETIEEMAADYVVEIVNVQPQGPYFLIGYSFGGLVAYEIARQLSAQGHHVGLVGLIDTRRRVSRMLTLLNLVLLPMRQKVKLLRTIIMGRIDDWRLGLGKHSAPPAAPNQKVASRPRRMYLVWKASLRAAERYVPPPYEGHVTMFRAREQLCPYVLNIVDYHWEKLALGGFDLQELPCNHASILTEPDVQYIVERMEAKLAHASAPRGAPPARVEASAQ